MANRVSVMPKVLLQNTANLGPWSNYNLETEVAREATFLVTTTGSPASFSIDLEGFHAGGPSNDWYPLLNVTAPGWYTVSSHWVKAFRANLKSISGGSSPTVSVTVAVA